MCIYEKGMHVLCVYNHVMWMLLRASMCMYSYVYNRNIDTVSGISGLWYDMFQYVFNIIYTVAYLSARRRRHER